MWEIAWNVCLYILFIQSIDMILQIYKTFQQTNTIKNTAHNLIIATTMDHTSVSSSINLFDLALKTRLETLKKKNRLNIH